MGKKDLFKGNALICAECRITVSRLGIAHLLGPHGPAEPINHAASCALPFLERIGAGAGTSAGRDPCVHL
jgi:hypothetical protein